MKHRMDTIGKKNYTLNDPFLQYLRSLLKIVFTDVADLDPDPLDPYVLGLLDPDPDLLVRGTGSGSGSFYHQSKNGNKTL
jgi:hypothetical protein